MNYKSFKPVAERDQFAQTPPWLYQLLHEKYNFTFDPCPANPDFDGLTADWGKSNYVNPPYKHIKRWLKKAVHERNKGNKSVFLVPLRPHCRYWQKLVLGEASDVFLIMDKIAFQGYEGAFPGSLCIIVYDPSQIERVGGEMLGKLQLMAAATRALPVML